MAVCHATHSFLHLLAGFCLPVYFSLCAWPPPSAPPLAAGASGAASGAGGSGRPPSRWRGALAAAHKGLRQAAGLEECAAVRWVVAWWLLVNAWRVCTVTAGL